MSQHMMVLADEDLVVRDAEDLVVPAPKELLPSREPAGERAHAVEVVAINRNDELGEIEILVHRVHVAGQPEQEGSRRDAGDEVLLWPHLRTAEAPPADPGKFSETRKFHLGDQTLLAFRPLRAPGMAELENLAVMMRDEVEIRLSVGRAKGELTKEILRRQAMQIGRVQPVDEI